MNKFKLKKLFIYVLLILLLIICITPFYIMIINGTRSSSEINSGVSLFPGKYLLQNYQNLTSKLNIGRGLLNSAIVAISATLLSSYISALTAYGFAFYKFPWRGFLLGVVLLFMMVPQHLGIIGYFELLNKVNLLDTRISLFLPAGANAFAVFFLFMYVKTVLPLDLIMAARVDGCGEFAIFNRIALPIMLPGIATMGIFTFVANWNNYLLPLVVIFSKEKYTMPMIIGQLNSTVYKRDFGIVYLAIAISIIPILIAFVFFARYLISGIAMGGVKE